MSNKEPVKLIIKSDGTCGGTLVKLSNGTDLGHVQKLTWSLEVGGQAKATIETIMTPAEINVIANESDITVINRVLPPTSERVDLVFVK